MTPPRAPGFTWEPCGGAYGAVILDAEENGIAECDVPVAPLLAAAHDLLTACEALIYALDGRVHTTAALMALDMARAAVARARPAGESAT